MAEWQHGLCSCLQEKTLSCLMCLCPCSGVAQVYTRMMSASCLLIGSILWVLFVTTSIFSTVASDVEEEGDGPLTSVAIFLCLLFSCTIFFLLCSARRAMREKYTIRGGELDDCCTAFWCGCCSLHMGGRLRLCTLELDENRTVRAYGDERGALLRRHIDQRADSTKSARGGRRSARSSAVSMAVETLVETQPVRKRKAVSEPEVCLREEARRACLEDLPGTDECDCSHCRAIEAQRCVHVV